MKIDNGMSSLNSIIQQQKPASRNPAGVAIADRMTAQERGLNQANRNVRDAVSLGQTADGAFSRINEDLQRIRELAVQAANGTTNNEDRVTIQQEISGLKENIQDALKNTSYNNLKVLDGGFQANIQGGADAGDAQQLNVGDASLAALGIDGFDVTGNFDISALDSAIKKVDQARSDIGASLNGFESRIRTNDMTRENTLASRSRVEDEDIAEKVSEFKKLQALNQFQIYVKKQEQAQEGQKLNVLGGLLNQKS